MLILTGAPALSEFRIAKVLASIRKRAEAVTGLDSRFLHFVDVERPLTTEEEGLLDSLLRYGPADTAGQPTGTRLIVLPRAGTVSPWSSKATAQRLWKSFSAVKECPRSIW